MWNILFLVMLLIVPTALYEILVEISSSFAAGDATILKVFIGILYVVLASVLVILIYENNTFKNRNIYITAFLIVGAVLFFLTYFSWVAILYTVVGLVTLKIWNDKNKLKAS